MANIRHIVLDVLKPHTPPLIEIASAIADLEGIDGVNIAVMDIDKEVEGIKVTIKGESINFERVKDIIEENGCSIHNVDKVSCGNEIVRDAPTPQD